MLRHMERQPVVFPVTHTVLAAPALARLVEADYDLAGTAVEVKLLNLGLSDTCLITAAADRYILRVYRAGWRTDADIRYEIEALDHLRRKGVPVAAPIARRDGGYLHAVEAPEGRRQIVLFAFAPGKEAYDQDDFPSRYGRAVARIHAASNDFHSEQRRFSLDLGELLDRPLAAIRPLLARRPDDWQYLLRFAGTLRERLAAVPEAALEWGFCHGDFHGGNAHLDGDTLTFFDFDCCGPGWRAYDVAVTLWDWALGDRAKADERWGQFLRGYREERPLGECDLAAVPLFVAIRQIWLLGLHTGNGQDWGYGWMNDRYFDDALKFLRDWERARLDGRDVVAAMARCG